MKKTRVVAAVTASVQARTSRGAINEITTVFLDSLGVERTTSCRNHPEREHADREYADLEQTDREHEEPSAR